MDLDALLHNYFGTDDPSTLDEEALAEGCQRIRIAFGTEREPGRRFALWALLHGLGDAPDPMTAFKSAREREAAAAYARIAGRAPER